MAEPYSCPPPACGKVLIFVRGGVAYHVATGLVEVVVVDADNIDAGDPPASLTADWLPLVTRLPSYDQTKYVQFVP